MKRSFRVQRSPQDRSLIKNIDKSLWKELRPVLSELGFEVKTWERSDFIDNNTVIISMDNKVYTLAVPEISMNSMQLRGPDNKLIAKYRNTLEDFIGQIRLYVQGLKENRTARYTDLTSEIDEVADEIQGHNPMLAFALDKISDKLESPGLCAA